ncbi:uncharacterized protein LOC129048880 [Pongo abelii]|uniref:uncharacterized protein LOC129048880 n=1 Tax=Pongo abelii TaxID=9601 RepID=UPI0023E8EF3B|nr:uncharacterized protein LOC129048880 [Pongo abelii]
MQQPSPATRSPGVSQPPLRPLRPTPLHFCPASCNQTPLPSHRKLRPLNPVDGATHSPRRNSQNAPSLSKPNRPVVLELSSSPPLSGRPRGKGGWGAESPRAGVLSYPGRGRGASASTHAPPASAGGRGRKEEEEGRANVEPTNDSGASRDLGPHRTGGGIARGLKGGVRAREPGRRRRKWSEDKMAAKLLGGSPRRRGLRSPAFQNRLTMRSCLDPSAEKKASPLL